MKREDPSFIPPSSIHAKETISRLGNLDAKRPRDDRTDEVERDAKREKNDDDDGEEMEIEDDEDAGSKSSASFPLQSHLIYRD